MVVEPIAAFECGRILRLAVASNGPYWAASDGRTLHLYCDDVPAMRGPLPGRLADGLRFDRGGTRVLLAPCVFDMALRSWHPSVPPDAISASNGSYEMHAAAWSPDGHELVQAMHHRASRRPGSADAGSAASEWLMTMRPAAAGEGSTEGSTLWRGDRADAIRAIAVNDHHIVAGGATPSVWERMSRRHVADLEAHERPVRDLAFAPDDALLASVGADGRLAIWNTATWTCAAMCQVTADELLAVAFHPRGPVLATGGVDGLLRLHDLSGALLHQEQLGAPITALAFAPAGNPLMVAVGGSEPRVVWLGLV